MFNFCTRHSVLVLTEGGDITLALKPELADFSSKPVFSGQKCVMYQCRNGHWPDTSRYRRDSRSHLRAESDQYQTPRYEHMNMLQDIEALIAFMNRETGSEADVHSD